MGPTLFAGISVSDFQGALAWYERLFGAEPSFRPHDEEAVWNVAEQGSIYVVLDPARAGHGHVTVFTDDLDARVEAIAERGLEPAGRETYSNGVRKVTYRDPEGNEVGFGG